MTVADIISQVNTFLPNHYDDDKKISWLANLDGMIFTEFITQYFPERTKCCCEEPLHKPYVPHTSLKDELIVPSPFGEDVYTSYLKAMINRENGETARYNLSIAEYNAAYSRFQAWYMRTHIPHSRGRFRF